MSKGILLFAFNNGNYNYYEMAVATAKRANYFLNLPVTIVTDSISLPETQTYTFDHTILVSAQTDNANHNGIWFNKGRYRAYELTPYDETILLDTDYLINSNTLLKLFDIYNDFMCHNKTSFLMFPNLGQEVVSSYSFDTLWATVIAFKKTKRVEQIFQCLQMVQENYEHYGHIYKFITRPYRNDYGLTIALRIANGHIDNTQDYIPWPLIHANKEVTVYKDDTKFVVLKDNKYIVVNDTDFHMMDKKNFMEIM